MAEQKIRVLLGKIGLDGHDRGVRMIATWLSKAGMEVVYLGTHQTAERMARAGVEEDADVIGLSFQGADHIPLVRMMAEQIKANGLEDRLLVVGGNVPRRDIPVLKGMGVDEVFPTATPMTRCVTYVLENARKRRK
jgi:methylmalonyl-CoA mutase C-terminal domain/subunit